MKSNSFDEWMRKPSILKILIFIDGQEELYCSLISRRINLCYRTTWVSLKYLKDNGLIVLIKGKKNSQKKVIRLTNKGKEIVNKLNELDFLFKQLYKTSD